MQLSHRHVQKQQNQPLNPAQDSKSSKKIHPKTVNKPWETLKFSGTHHQKKPNGSSTRPYVTRFWWPNPETPSNVKTQKIKKNKLTPKWVSHITIKSPITKERKAVPRIGGGGGGESRETQKGFSRQHWENVDI